MQVFLFLLSIFVANMASAADSSRPLPKKAKASQINPAQIPFCTKLTAEQYDEQLDKLLDEKISRQHPASREILKIFRKRIRDKLILKCSRDRCLMPEAYRVIHEVVEEHIGWHRKGGGLALLLATAMAGVYTDAAARFNVLEIGRAIAFITFAGTVGMSAAFFKDAVQNVVHKWSYHSFGPPPMIGEGLNDAQHGRSGGSEDVKLFRKIIRSIRASVGPLEFPGWLRFQNMLSQARGVIRDTANLLKDPSEDDFNAAALAVATFLNDLRNLPGAIPHDHPEIMNQVELYLIPAFAKQTMEQRKAFYAAVLIYLHIRDENFNALKHLQIDRERPGHLPASLFYDGVMRDWKMNPNVKISRAQLDAVTLPKDLYKRWIAKSGGPLSAQPPQSTPGDESESLNSPSEGSSAEEEEQSDAG